GRPRPRPGSAGSAGGVSASSQLLDPFDGGLQRGAAALAGVGGRGGQIAPQVVVDGLSGPLGLGGQVDVVVGLQAFGGQGVQHRVDLVGAVVALDGVAQVASQPHEAVVQRG